MPKIISPFTGTSPIATTISDLGKSLWGDQVSGAIKRAQQEKLERENYETRRLMDATAAGINVGDPAAQAYLVGSGYDPQHYAIINRMNAASQSNFDPVTRSQIGAGQDTGSTVYGYNKTAAEIARNNNLASSDRRYGTDVGATTMRRGQDLEHGDRRYNTDVDAGTARYNTDQTQGTERWKFENTPEKAIDPVTGLPVYVTRRALIGPTGSAPPDPGVAGEAGAPVPVGTYTPPRFQPVLSETEQKGRILGNIEPTLSPFERKVAGGAAASTDQVKAGLFQENFPNLGGLDPYQRKGLDVEPAVPRAPDNYVDGRGGRWMSIDGRTDVRTGQRLPSDAYKINVQGGANETGVTNAVQSDLQGKSISYQMFNSLADQAEVLTSDPTLFGPVGNLRGKAQDLLQSFGGTAQVLGVGQQFANTVSDINGQKLGPVAAQKLIPELYDPRLPEVETLWGLLLYSGASALAGQENRSVSDKDIAMMRDILGDPHSFFASNLSMATKLRIAKRVVNANAGVVNNALQNGIGAGVAPITPPLPNAAPPQGRPPSVVRQPANTPPIVQWGRDANGRPVQLAPRGP